MTLGRKRSSKSFIITPANAKIMKPRGRGGSNTESSALKDELEKLKTLYTNATNHTQQSTSLLAEFTRNQVKMSASTRNKGNYANRDGGAFGQKYSSQNSSK